jgi:hypothetical protein
MSLKRVNNPAEIRSSSRVWSIDEAAQEIKITTPSRVQVQTTVAMKAIIQAHGEITETRIPSTTVKLCVLPYRLGNVGSGGILANHSSSVRFKNLLRV